MTNKKQNGDILIFWAIVIAALIIGGALLWTRGDKTASLFSVKQSESASKKDLLQDFNFKDYPIMGNPTAPLTMLIFSDFQCHFCKLFAQTIKPTLVEKYVKTSQLKIIHLDFPFLSQESGWAAQAAQCANDQNKYWNYTDELHKIQAGHDPTVFSRKNLVDIARELSMDIGQFNQCLDSEKYMQKIQNSFELGKKMGVDGTPTVFINKQKIDGAQPLEVFEKAIEEEFKKQQ